MSVCVSPVPRLTFQANDGSPAAGCKLYTYLAGTTTPQATYSDQDLAIGHANPNPTVLNSAGRPEVSGSEVNVYLAAVSYKFVLTTSSGTIIWTADNVEPTASALASTTTNYLLAQGRLTLTSGSPVTNGDVTAATTVYFAPYGGSRIALYDGAAWNIRAFTQISIAVPSTTATMYDVFAYDNSGTVTLELTAWTNDTTRATALTTQDGVYVKTGVLTRRYLGSMRTTGSSGQTEDSVLHRFLWNYYNRVPRSMRAIDTTDTWTYTTNAYQQANASAANQLAFIVGVAEVELSATVYGTASSSSGAGVLIAVAIGLDSTTAKATGVVTPETRSQVANQPVTPFASLLTYPAVGYHYAAWLEYSQATGTTTWIGDNGGAIVQTGIFGDIDG